MGAAGNVLLSNARVVRRDGSVEGPADVAVRSGVIASVTPKAALPAQEKARPVDDLPVVDCDGCYMSPGLVNLHTHSPMAVLRGIAEDVSIDDWFNVRIFPYESRLTLRDVRIGALLAIFEMVDSGVTAFFDHYFMAQEVVAAARATGIRADVAPTVFGLGEWQAALRDSLELMARVNGEQGLVRVRLGPHAPYTCPPPVLEACAEAARKTGAGIHIHVSETRRQVEESLRLYGKTPFRVLHDAGIMDVECVFAHGTWMRREEVPLVSKPSFLAVAPKTYLKLSSGAGNLYEVLRFLGYPDGDGPLQVGIGTDGAASSNTQSPLEQARLFALLGKDRWGDATTFDLATVWRTLMAGHDALGQNTGDVAEGYAADLVVWDLAHAPTWPVACPAGALPAGQEALAAILYSADSQNVRDVMVSGRFLKRSGKVVAMDTAEVMADSLAVRQRLMAEGVGQARVRY